MLDRYSITHDFTELDNSLIDELVKKKVEAENIVVNRVCEAYLGRKFELSDAADFTLVYAPHITKPTASQDKFFITYKGKSLGVICKEIVNNTYRVSFVPSFISS